MEKQNQIFDLGEQNILEEFYELVEKHRLSSNEFQLGDFYDALNNFDLAYQNYNTENNAKSNAIVNKYLVHCLYLFLVIFKFKGFSDRPVFYAFKKFINWFTIVLQNSNGINSDFFFAKNISENFPSLWQGDFIKFLNQNLINFNLFNPKQFDSYLDIVEDAEYNISKDFGIKDYFESLKTQFFVFGNEFKVIELEYISLNNTFKKVQETYEMTIDIEIDMDDNDGAKLIAALNYIMSSLSNIENVKLEIEEIYKGSLKAKIRVFMKDLIAKEETKAVLETSKEAVIKALTAGQVSHVETKKTTAETKKIYTEEKLLENELKSKPSEFESKMANALELEKKALENESLRIQNVRDKLEIISKLSDLATKGILEADDIRIDINEILYILKEKEDLQIPDVNIDNII
jgi:hypothetical protein